MEKKRLEVLEVIEVFELDDPGMSREELAHRMGLEPSPDGNYFYRKGSYSLEATRRADNPARVSVRNPRANHPIRGFAKKIGKRKRS